MSGEFYDPLIWTAGKIAEEYSVSVSDVLGLLLSANKDEALVRQALSESTRGASTGGGGQIDVVQAARDLLERTLDEPSGEARRSDGSS
ncbi:MAG TPA: hypothetical protein VM409_03280 [Chloroflexia bacterium]|nr:hypothetical protein [Chloroflexia bacterium]